MAVLQHIRIRLQGMLVDGNLQNIGDIPCLIFFLYQLQCIISILEYKVIEIIKSIADMHKECL